MRPGDYWITCDISGFRVPRSRAKRTWDGLLVDPLYWSPKHPQLEVRPVLEGPGPDEVRPPVPPKFIYPDYGYGTLCFLSPGGKTFVVCVDYDGALLVVEGKWGNPLTTFGLCKRLLSVSDDGALLVSGPIAEPTINSWTIKPVDGSKTFIMTVASDGAVLLTEV
ncbi:MAG: hypothetical protein N3E40_00140 [Dehalococcoidia bacterium]|nr:hypothetical protein [Dehalococcoidia bacterium]